MNKYVLMTVAAALIAAAPAYYAFQAQAEETVSTKAGVEADAAITTDGPVVSGQTDTDIKAKADHDHAMGDDASAESRSPGSPRGESDVDASTSTDSVSE